MHRTIATPILLTALLTAGGALAEPNAGADQYERTFASDGTTAEQNRDEAFDQMDRNQDGKLDEDELSAWGSTAAGQPEGDREDAERRTRRMLDQFDHDNDDAISREELDAGPDDAGEARGSNF